MPGFTAALLYAIMSLLKKYRNLITLLLLLLTAAFSKDKCATLRFPTLNGSLMITAAENETIVLPFVLSNMTCIGQKQIEINVWKSSRTSDLPLHMCTIRLQDGKCLGMFRQVCTCVGDNHFTFSERVDRADVKWMLKSDVFTSKTVTASIIYPAEVKELKLVSSGSELSSPLEPGSQPSISCTWQNGNPEVHAHLIHSRMSLSKDVVLLPETTTLNADGLTTSYTLDAVHCKDAGFIQCEAPGASRNKTLPLLVKCKPEFVGDEWNVITVESGDDVTRRFPVRAHTTTFDKCLLHKHASDSHGFTDVTLLPCESLVNLTGTPPDLVLIVWLDNVRKQDEGQWRLELTNDAGTGLLEFSLIVTDGQWKIITGACVAAGFVILLVTITTVCVRKNTTRKRRHTMSSEPALELAIIERQSRLPQEDGSDLCEHLYSDLDSLAFDDDAAACAADCVPKMCHGPGNPHRNGCLNPLAGPSRDERETPPPVCHGPRDPADDYLSPAPSRDETEEEGSEWKTVPFYQNTQIRNLGATTAAYDSAKTQDDASPTDRTLTASGVSNNPHTDYCNTEIGGTGYIGYDPRLYENTRPRH